jgi:hypothetical protein
VHFGGLNIVRFDFESIRCRRCKKIIEQFSVFFEQKQWNPYFIQGRKRISIRAAQTYCLIWVKFGVTDFHIVLLNVCEFCGNQRRESRPFVMDPTVTRVQWNCMTFCKWSTFCWNLCTTVRSVPFVCNLVEHCQMWKCECIQRLVCAFFKSRLLEMCGCL